MQKTIKEQKCTECNKIFEMDEILKAENPFYKQELIYGCPECFSIDSFLVICDEVGCKDVVTCGTPTKEGYRGTCGKHKPK